MNKDRDVREILGGVHHTSQFPKGAIEVGEYTPAKIAYNTESGELMIFPDDGGVLTARVQELEGDVVCWPD